MVVDLGETEVFVRQVLQRSQRLGYRNAAGFQIL
jgi:hypothetical protein